MTSYTSSTKTRFDLATKLGENGKWISQGSYSTLASAKARGDQWLKAAGPSGRYQISNEIGKTVISRPRDGAQ